MKFMCNTFYDTGMLIFHLYTFRILTGVVVILLLLLLFTQIFKQLAQLGINKITCGAKSHCKNEICKTDSHIGSE